MVATASNAAPHQHYLQVYEGLHHPFSRAALRSNRDALEGLAGSVNSGDRIERDANRRDAAAEMQQWRLQQQCRSWSRRDAAAAAVLEL
jgi:hypothetical protein